MSLQGSACHRYLPQLISVTLPISDIQSRVDRIAAQGTTLLPAVDYRDNHQPNDRVNTHRARNDP
ncbi:hypothetical protein HBH56_168100 [Parastagonospora nodorum]|uniref:Uncharacterized protein n=1 Tax=Phaeosphaeria nodorum (strain SN15 / ATCC MYA-4574 / FGSC 10173) TaxID=321614 RepID=A0A7U2F8X8_PHANO|nr:hypothetical protein HBH56_168100 [Parastagonospora nodorum]QRC98675.1 hypothetical protein JI435_412430 [Parastagonospora nodorum SN15]KAH3936312.1 hypothetical protein HBH54_031190 [Parastagonospora nodorum]KAH3948427.1 hypothetical protein HBH53_105960 [Parastagonospora nodorum]KAH4145016.1 hypothetical protein HBH45_021680 [Parastagonospora nodorum]